MEKSNDVARGEAMGKPKGNEWFREKKEAINNRECEKETSEEQILKKKKQQEVQQSDG